MSRRQAFKDILNHLTPSQTILDLEGCPLSGMSPEAAEALYTLLGYELPTPSDPQRGAEAKERLLRYLDIDTRGVGYIFRPQKSQYHRISHDEYIDEWGIRRKFTGLYWDIVDSPLRDAEVSDLDAFEWPDPDAIDPREIEAVAQEAKRLHDHTDYIICASHPVYGIFELGCWMCGFDDFMIKMALDPDFVKRFFEIILDYQKRVIRQYYAAIGPYIHFTSSGDDFATQSSLFVSPDMFRELIAPYFAERIAYTKTFTSAPYLHHSCGNVSALIPQLIGCGVDMLNPIQPTGEAMAPERLKSAYGRDIVFHGGLDTQSVLPAGNRESVTAAVYSLLDAMQPDGGYVFAAAHNLQADVPPENIVAMFQAARSWKR